eukprot:TRINITY_DN12440_c0_g1_i1.p1 TRINITY_DN12440_c0_g1~~TRINITY_DN12440_c0_g1_i1.p1  ORF type:complete len:122 (+),score=19.03 TRINITY_DN12440_c0_g1_i1:148-513(+)
MYPKNQSFNNAHSLAPSFSSRNQFVLGLACRVLLLLSLLFFTPSSTTTPGRFQYSTPSSGPQRTITVQSLLYGEKIVNTQSDTVEVVQSVVIESPIEPPPSSPVNSTHFFVNPRLIVGELC